MRILHVVGGMNRGGTETWLMHVLRNIDRRQFQMDFLVHTSEPCAYDDEINALGSRIIPCLHPWRPRTYAHNLKRILRDYGPYDVVHSHVHHYSGYVLRLAEQAGVPFRVAHSHSDTTVLQARAGVLRRTYLDLMRRWINRYATVGLACSGPAAAALFGRSWQQDPRYRILHCGVDLGAFRATEDPAVRGELGIASDSFVVGHVGRFAEAKNHTFLIDVAAEVVRRDPAVCFLLVGDGPLRPLIESKVSRLHLGQHVILTGLRADVPRLMLGAMDLFLFPSLYEGLPLTLLEAQASGLPCICSDVIAEQVVVATSMTRRLSLSLSASAWADAIQGMRADQSRGSLKSDALHAFEQSPFTIASSSRALADVYARSVGGPVAKPDPEGRPSTGSEWHHDQETGRDQVGRDDPESAVTRGMSPDVRA